MNEWLPIFLAVASPLATLLGNAFFFGRKSATVEGNVAANTKAIDDLAASTQRALETMQRAIDTKVSAEQGRGLQAQIKRLETADAECEGRITAIRDEFGSRAERVNERMANAERNHTAEASVTAGLLGEVRADIRSLRDAMERFDREESARRAAAAAPAQNDMLSMLTMLAQMKPVLKQLVAN